MVTFTSMLPRAALESGQEPYLVIEGFISPGPSRSPGANRRNLSETRALSDLGRYI